MVVSATAGLNERFPLIQTEWAPAGRGIPLSDSPGSCLGFGSRARSHWEGVLAEPEGFEPSIPGKRYAALAKRCLQPLGHSSIMAGYARHRLRPQAQRRDRSSS